MSTIQPSEVNWYYNWVETSILRMVEQTKIILINKDEGLGITMDIMVITTNNLNIIIIIDDLGNLNRKYG